MSESVEYSTVKLPIKFLKEYVDPLVDDDKMGYNSRPDVIKDAIRDFYAKVVSQQKLKAVVSG